MLTLRQHDFCSGSPARGQPYTATIATRPLNTQRAEQRRRQLLDAAVEVFSDNDYDEVSADDVATAAGVSHGLVFQYFGSKKGLYVAALETIVKQFQERVLHPPPDVPAPAQLESALGVYVEWAVAHPAGYRSLMRTASGMTETRESVEASRWRGLEPIAAGLRLDLEDSRTRVALRGWIGFMEASILVWLDEKAPEMEELVQLITRSLLDLATRLHRRGG